MTITAERNCAGRARDVRQHAAVAGAERRRAGFPASSYLKPNSGSTRLWLQPIHPREIEARPRRQRPGQPLRRQELLRGNAADGLSASHPGRDARSQDTPAARPAPRPSASSRLSCAPQALRTSPSSWTPRSITLGAHGRGSWAASAGQGYWGSAGASATSEFLRNVEVRASISRLLDEYDHGDANSANDIASAAGPGYDFAGKWVGRVAHLFRALRGARRKTRASRDNYTNEGDWFDYSVKGPRTRRGPGQRPLRPDFRRGRTCGAISETICSIGLPSRAIRIIRKACMPLWTPTPEIGGLRGRLRPGASAAGMGIPCEQQDAGAALGLRVPRRKASTAGR